MGKSGHKKSHPKMTFFYSLGIEQQELNHGVTVNR